MYVFVRDARSPANDAVTYAILHNKHKITYIQTSVCVCLRVCVWCVNAAVVAASIWPYPLSIFYILEPVISCDEPCSLWSCWCCCYYGNLSWWGRRHSLLLPPSAAATRGEIWCCCCCFCCYCYYCQSVLEIMLIIRYRWDMHRFELQIGAIINFQRPPSSLLYDAIVTFRCCAALRVFLCGKCE